MQYDIFKCRSVDLNISSDPFNGAGPGPYPSFMEPADDDEDRVRDREQGGDWGDDGDNNDFSLIGDEDCQVNVRFLCLFMSCPVLSCPVLSCPVLSCPVLSCLVLSCFCFTLVTKPYLAFLC